MLRFEFPQTTVLFHDPLLHSVLETLNCFLALSLGGLLYVLQQRLQWSTKFLWIACSMLSMGVLMGIHAVVSRDDNSLAMLETTYNFMGGLWAAGCWFPRAWLMRPAGRRLLIVGSVTSALIVGFALLNWPQALPAFAEEGGRYTQFDSWASAVAGLLFLSAAIRCAIDYRHSRRIKDLYIMDFLLLSGAASTFTGNFLFVWGPIWWSWHVLQLVGFLSVLALFVYIAVCFESDLSSSENRFRKLCDELDYTNRDLRQFTAFASHDLKEPVRTIHSFLTLLERRYGNRLEKEGIEFLNHAKNGAHRLSEMIDGFLQYARVDCPSETYSQVPLDAVFQGVRDNLRLLITESGAEITSDGLPTLVADRAQLADLFQNLIVNAIRYRDPNRIPRLHISATNTRGTWTLSFTDNGIGIDKSFQQAIFEPLKRLHGSEVEGTGLGLAICKKIVERHSGELTVTSQVGVGTTFFISFPPLPARNKEERIARTQAIARAIRKG